MEMKEQITQEEAAARGMMEAEYDQLAELVTALQANLGMIGRLRNSTS